MRISDWSSDVCSSDLAACLGGAQAGGVQSEIALRDEAPEAVGRQQRFRSAAEFGDESLARDAFAQAQAHHHHLAEPDRRVADVGMVGKIDEGELARDRKSVV